MVLTGWDIANEYWPQILIDHLALLTINEEMGGQFTSSRDDVITIGVSRLSTTHHPILLISET